MTRKLGLGLAWILGLAVALIVVWMVVIGPVAVFRVIANGTTTVWDHTVYPGRELTQSPEPAPWATSTLDLSGTQIVIGEESRGLQEVLTSTPTLSFVVIDRGEVRYEWYADGHSAGTPVMTFSISKSILGLMIGAAIDDGLIDAVTDPVTRYLPEMAPGGLDGVTIEQLLTMGSSLDYVEDDNPFGSHVKFNYTPDLALATLALQVRAVPDEEFRYKSGDYAVLGLILDRVLGEITLTDYLQTRLWDRVGASNTGIWSTDREDGLERAWCCLATTARDLARFGQLIADRGMWDGEQLISEDWVEASTSAHYPADRWPDEYQESPLHNYGYGWWQMADGAWAGQGKGGQYLYVVPDRGIVVVRQGEATGGISWAAVISQVVGSIR
jgi:CubicO group peptidase (beta-lactamase class C family)